MKPLDKNNTYLKYSGLAFQLLILIGIGCWIGHWLDAKYNNETPYFTAFFSIIFLIGGLYSVLKEFISKK